MGTQVFDDGSTLTTDAAGNVVGVTMATDNGAFGTPADYSTGAKDWGSVLQNGFSRLIDVATVSAINSNRSQPINTTRYSAAYPIGAGQSVNIAGLQLPVPLLLMGVAAWFFLKK